MTKGSVKEFAANWQRPEADYCHFTRGEPENQIQFAFRQNWLEFAKIMEPLRPWCGMKSLEVGAGRGTMSMYFADNGFNCTLLDACEEPVKSAHEAFRKHSLRMEYVTDDALKMPFKDESFDVVHSYGLMEHFESTWAIIDEQYRVLRKGGVLIAYVVPNPPNSAMPWMDMINTLLYGYDDTKESVYRNGDCAASYEYRFQDRGLEVDYNYVYPYPLVGPSPDFPFSLCSPSEELNLVRWMKKSLARKPWAQKYCGDHQAFIVWGWKR